MICKSGSQHLVWPSPSAEEQSHPQAAHKLLRTVTDWQAARLPHQQAERAAAVQPVLALHVQVCAHAAAAAQQHPGLLYMGGLHMQGLGSVRGGPDLSDYIAELVMHSCSCCCPVMLRAVLT
eukprot:1159827-Pelagomonas_calceolata.AAC.17